MTLRPYLPVKGILGGALTGLGMFVLMQQFAVIYPSRRVAAVSVLGGALVMLVMANVVRGVAAGRLVPAAAAHRPAATYAAAPTPAPTAEPGFHATHRAPAAGLDAYEAPGAATTVARLDPGLEVVVLQRTGDWTQVVCSNGWTTWVDGRLLVVG